MTWTQKDTASLGKQAWSSVTSSADGTKLVAASMDIFTSTDSGTTWTRRAGTRATWRSLASSADGTRLIAASDSLVYTSTDSGLGWLVRDMGPHDWTCVASSADGAKLVAVATQDWIATSNNAGLLWEMAESRWKSVALSADGKTMVVAPAAPAIMLSKGVRGSCELKVIETRGTWLHVLRDGPSRITGWIQESELKSTRRPNQSRDKADDVCMFHVRSGSGGFDVEYEGPARVRAGTVIGPGAWAQLPEEKTFNIVVRSDRAEVALMLQGMSLVPKSADAFYTFYLQWIPAWIPRSAVIMPDSARSRAVEQGVGPDDRSPSAPARRSTP